MTSEVQPKNTVDTILQPGKIVDGKYRVDKLVGRGGMAAVWAGTNERTGKSVALKVILKSFAATPEAEQLFRREALAASKVNHPNVVTVFDVIDHDGMTCIVMELLDGEPLSNYLARKGFLSAEEAIALLLPAMRGVSAANAQGVVHRDLKPQNIFICIGPDGRHVTTKVLDFGISVMVERALDASSSTIPGLTMGTPAYMSPEHVSGARNIDERADVYGFGVLLYEMLTGQLPFMGEPGPALLLRILNESAPPVTLFRPDLPPALVRIVEAAMAKKPDHRYSDVNSLVRALEEEFMPPTPLPRSLTPFAGVPVFPFRDGPSGRQSSAISVPRLQDVSGPNSHSETQMLFALSMDMERPVASVATRSSVDTASSGAQTTLVSTIPDWIRPVTNFVGRKGGLIIGVVIVVAIVFFLAMPSISQQVPVSPVSPIHSATPATLPSITKVTPIPASVPGILPLEPGVPSVSVTQGDSKQELVEEATEPVDPSGSGSASRARASSGSRRQEIRGKGLADSVSITTKTSTAIKSVSAAKSSAPRAGNLSADDF